MLFETTRRPDDGQLRQFALTLLAFVTLAVALDWIRHGMPSTPVLAAAATFWCLGLVGVAAPRRIEWVFVTAMTATRPVGRVVSELMLLMLYFGVMTPMALVFRVMRRDRLQRAIDRSCASYWLPRRVSRDDPARYFRQS